MRLSPDLSLQHKFTLSHVQLMKLFSRLITEGWMYQSWILPNVVMSGFNICILNFFCYMEWIALVESLYKWEYIFCIWCTCGLLSGTWQHLCVVGDGYLEWRTQWRTQWRTWWRTPWLKILLSCLYTYTINNCNWFLCAYIAVMTSEPQDGIHNMQYYQECVSKL